MLPAFATVLRATKAPLLPSISDDFLRSTILPPPALYGGVQGPPGCAKARSHSPSSETSSSCSETSVPEGLMMISRYLEGFKSERPVRENRKFEIDMATVGPQWAETTPKTVESKKRERCSLSKNDSGLERAILRSGIERLQSMLPTEGKAKLAEVIRRYLRAQVSPEIFAEEIHRLADHCRSVHRGERRHAPSHRPMPSSSATADEHSLSAAEVASRRASKRSKSSTGEF